MGGLAKKSFTRIKEVTRKLTAQKEVDLVGWATIKIGMQSAAWKMSFPRVDWFRRFTMTSSVIFYFRSPTLTQS
jgi:hypothetical protein